MAIEFRCTKCNKLLRTADNTAGKHARCPECGEVLAIPAGGATFTPPASPPSTPPPASPFSSPLPSAGGGGFSPPPPSGPTGGSPFGAGQQPEYQLETGNPYQSPSAYAPLPTSPAAATEIRPTIIDLGDVMSRSWRIFKEQWGMVLGAVIIVGLCNGAFGFVTQTILKLFYNPVIDVQNVPPDKIFAVMMQDLPRSMFVSALKGYVDLIFVAWTTAGLYLVLLKIARGEPASIGDIFSGGNYFVSMLIAIFLFKLMVNIGILLLIVPGIIIYLMFGQFGYLIVDRNMGVMESFEMSKTITTGNKMTLFLIGLACLGIALATVITCGLGMIVAAPYIALLHAVIYLSMTGQPTVDQMRTGMGIQ